MYIGSNLIKKADTEKWIYPIIQFDQPESDAVAAERIEKKENIGVVNANITGTKLHELTIQRALLGLPVLSGEDFRAEIENILILIQGQINNNGTLIQCKKFHGIIMGLDDYKDEFILRNIGKFLDNFEKV